MSGRRLVEVAVLVAVFTAGALWSQCGPVRPAQAQTGTSVVPLADVEVRNPVVACTPCQFSVENDLDRFERTLILGSRTTVNSVVLVRADGTTEVRKVGAK